ncbi:MAG TPA: PAAR domain-containing protein [Archangium sp.]|nr:PAAR domain-containing protein [Archangium sp.]
MPPAARISDMHVCPKVEPGPVPHVGGPISSGEGTVLIGFQPAARVGDSLVCNGPPDSISQGEPTVIIGGKPAARLGDPTSHGGVIVVGFPTVLIGVPAQGKCLVQASASGAALVTKADG